MPVNTGIPTNLRRPQTFHRFTYQLGSRQLVPLPLTAVLIGTHITAAPSVAGTVYDVYDAEQGDTLFGIGSEIAIMIRKAIETSEFLGFGPSLKAIGIDEPGAGTANIGTITITGPATASGNVTVNVAGRVYIVGVTAGDSATIVATAIKNAMLSDQRNCPVVASNVAGVVSLTYPHKGVNGAQVFAEVMPDFPAGLTFVVNNAATPGAGVIDITTSLDATAGLDIDGIAISNTTMTDVTDYEAHLAVMWGPAEKKWRWGFIGSRDTIGNATTLASGANAKYTIVGVCEKTASLPGEIATALCVGAFSRSRPNANYNGMVLPLAPPANQDAFSGTEVEAALAAGLTPLTPVFSGANRQIVDNRLKVERLVTTKTTESGNPYEPLRDLGVSRTGAYLARQLDIAYIDRFGPQANPDGVLFTDDFLDRLRDMIAGLLYEAQELDIVRNVETDLAQLIVEKDPIALGRADVDLPYSVVLGANQVAFVHRVKVGA